MKTASARHILVDDEPTCVVLKQWLEDGSDFGEVVFSGELGKILGPVHTQFGYHLIEITARSD